MRLLEADIYSLDRHRCHTCGKGFSTATVIIPQPGSQGRLHRGWVLDSHSVAFPIDQKSLSKCLHCRLPGLYPPEAGSFGVFKTKPCNRIRDVNGRIEIT